MRKATELDSLAELEEAVPHSVIKYSDTPIVILQRASAGNDATCEDPAISRDDVEPWARHALSANGFGDVVATDAASSAQASYELYQAARAHRSFSLGEIIVAAVQEGVAIARRAYARYRQRQEARATYDALRELDDHTLRDLGFDRSEIRSVVAEVTGEAERTRVRTISRAETPARRVPSASFLYQNELPTSH